jgi:cupin 2 domain-containing protein
VSQSRDRSGNLFDDLPPLPAVGSPSPPEQVDLLMETRALRLERIVSTGQATPPGEWFDQDRDEWVVVLRGRAGIRFADQDGVQELRPGDWLHIRAHRRHRVEWTDAREPTIWLALHHHHGGSGRPQAPDTGNRPG